MFLPRTWLDATYGACPSLMNATLLSSAICSQIARLPCRLDASENLKTPYLLRKRLQISESQRHAFEEQIRTYWGEKSPLPADVSLSMLHVMMHRYNVRRNRTGPSLFENDEESDAEASVVVAANDAVYEAAIFQLFQRYDRPYYFGIDAVCDASSENAELFLQLSAELVEAVATQIARNRPATLTPAMQNKLLRERHEVDHRRLEFPPR